MLFINDINQSWSTCFCRGNSNLIWLPVLELDQSIAIYSTGARERDYREVFDVPNNPLDFISLPLLLHYNLALVLIMYSSPYPLPLPPLFFLWAFHPLQPPSSLNRYEIMMKWSFLFFGLMPCLKLIPLIMRPRLRKNREHEIQWQSKSLYFGHTGK